MLGAFAALCAGTAQAAVPAEFYGVTPQRPLGSADVDRMGQAQVGTLRFEVSWALIDPTSAPGDYNWAATDALVADAARNGIELLPFVYSTPTWVATELDRHNCSGAECYPFAPRSTPAKRAWETFLRDLVLRYGPNGEFWTLNPTLPRDEIRTWQLWNEQNSPSFYKPKPKAKAYAKLLDAASRGIRSADGGAEIVLGGMFGTPLGGRKPGISAWRFLEGLYNVKGAKKNFDGVAPHPYAAKLKKVKAQVNLIRDEMRAGRDRNADLWITELGWGSGGPKNPLNRGPSGPGAAAEAGLQVLRAQAPRLEREQCRLVLVAGQPGRRRGPLRVVPAVGPAERERRGEAVLPRLRQAHRWQLSILGRRMRLRFTIIAVVGALLSIAIASSASGSRAAVVLRHRAPDPAHRDRHRPHGSGQRRDAADHRQLVGRRSQPRRRRLQLGEHRYDRRGRSTQRDHDPALPLRDPHWVVEGLDGRSCGPAKCALFAPSKAAALDAWTVFVRDAVARYGPNGAFWAANPDLPQVPITAWQIWNEQNSKSFYLPRPNVGKYLKLLQAANAAVKSVDPNAEVVLGGMAELAGSKKAVPGPEYLQSLYRRKGAKNHFDGVAPHPTGRKLKGVKQQVNEFRKAMKRGGDAGADLWVTEIGVGLGPRRQPAQSRAQGPGQGSQAGVRLLHQERRAAEREGGHLVQLDGFADPNLRVVRDVGSVHPTARPEALLGRVHQVHGRQLTAAARACQRARSGFWRRPRSRSRRSCSPPRAARAHRRTRTCRAASTEPSRRRR